MRRENGTGSIVKLSGTRRRPWLARVPATEDPVDGRTIQKTLGTYKTRLDAERALIEYLDRPTDLTEITVKELFDEWSKIHFENISKGTAEGYVTNFKKLKRIHDLKVKDLNTPILQKALNDSSHMASSSISLLRVLISLLCKEALRRQIITIDYSSLLITPKGKAPKEKQIFSDIDIQKMWGLVGKVKNIEIPLILIYTGMRIGELVTCKVAYVNLEDRYILHGIKTEAGRDRIIPLPKRILPIITEICKNNKNYLFEHDGGKPYCNGQFYQVLYSNALKDAGIKRLTSHACRRTYATMLNATVMNKEYISRILGHADFDTTDKYYIIPRSKELVDAVSNL